MGAVSKPRNPKVPAAARSWESRAFPRTWGETHRAGTCGPQSCGTIRGPLSRQPQWGSATGVGTGAVSPAALVSKPVLSLWIIQYYHINNKPVLSHPGGVNVTTGDGLQSHQRPLPKALQGAQRQGVVRYTLALSL